MSGDSKTDSYKTARSLIIGAIVLIAVAGVVVLFFNRLAGADLILARGDTFLYFYPYWQSAADALKEGQVPLWNANLFMGAPFLANSQVGYFYPLNWPLWLLLETPYAVSFSVILHLIIAGCGVYLVGRRCFEFSSSAAVLATLLFSLGGYLTAQVEHINQIQGIAWLPWYFVVLCPWRPFEGSRRHAAKVSASIAAILSLQLLSGHTQTAFISVMGTVIWLAVRWLRRPESQTDKPSNRSSLSVQLKSAWSFFSPVIAGFLLAVCITSVQLLPTLELSGQSLRQGGLPSNEVLSFSLQPLLLAQSFLPAYDYLVFSEYVAFVPVTAILLAILGIGRVWRLKQTQPFIVLAVAGLLLALGRFNPLYHLLAIVPGFSYFRAPARWSVLLAFVVALMAAAGWQALAEMAQIRPKRREQTKKVKVLAAGAIIVGLLVAWSLLSAFLAPLLPAAPEALVERPSAMTLIAWMGELAVAVVLMLLILRGHAGGLVAWAIFAATIVILFISTRILPYNHPTTPAAYFEQRAPVSRMMASAKCSRSGEPCQASEGRVLGLSDIFFDLGDQAELYGIYSEKLGEREWFDYLVASKHKEVLGPNLPLAYGLESVDGFDGGVLPLENYASFMRVILPEGELTFDGRLREHLDSVPDERWLDLFGAKYIIADKVGDEWRREVFFDMKLPTTISIASGPLAIGYIPEFEASDLWLISDGHPGKLTVQAHDGNQWDLEPDRIESDLWQVSFPKPTRPVQIILNPCQQADGEQSCEGDWTAKSLALVDRRDGSFMPLSVGDYRLVYSGDVKIYENLDVLPRATLIYDWQFARNVEDSILIMKASGFDPSRSAVVAGEGPEAEGSGSGRVEITSRQPERITLRSESDSTALLLFTEAFYPGWAATIDGMPAEIAEADIMFRGIFVPAGAHEIELAYVPISYKIGRIVSLIGMVIWAGLVTYGLILPTFRKSQIGDQTTNEDVHSLNDSPTTGRHPSRTD